MSKERDVPPRIAREKSRKYLSTFMAIGTVGLLFACLVGVWHYYGG